MSMSEPVGVDYNAVLQRVTNHWATLYSEAVHNMAVQQAEIASLREQARIDAATIDSKEERLAELEEQVAEVDGE
jgi:hypothetical protein